MVFSGVGGYSKSGMIIALYRCCLVFEFSMLNNFSCFRAMFALNQVGVGGSEPGDSQSVAASFGHSPCTGWWSDLGFRWSVGCELSEAAPFGSAPM